MMPAVRIRSGFRFTVMARARTSFLVRQPREKSPMIRRSTAAPVLPRSTAPPPPPQGENIAEHGEHTWRKKCDAASVNLSLRGRRWTNQKLAEPSGHFPVSSSGDDGGRTSSSAPPPRRPFHGVVKDAFRRQKL